MRPRSLRAQLLVGVLAIVSAALISIGAVAVMSLRDEVHSLSDSQVVHSLAALGYSHDRGLDANLGQAPGTVIALLRDGRAASSMVVTDGGPTAAAPEVVRDLEAAGAQDGAPRTVVLGSLGPHRVGSQGAGAGERLVSAVSMVEANRTLAHNTLLVAALVLLALLATAGATAVLVRNALKPLRRVAAIAGQVATLPLEAAEYRITARVDERDTDPDNEVGTVGLTLNHMLDNVDSALTKMARSDRHTRQFLTDASHELRTPLAAIRGYAELTRQESDQLPPMTEYALERIESESRRMSTLVDDLLLLSRLDERQDLQIEQVDLCDLVAHAVNDAAVSAPDHHFRTDLPDGPVPVLGDQARLQQLVVNLLGNTRVHTPEGTTVTTSVGLSNGAVEILVSDDGPGIPEEILPNLFGRFVRADKGRSREMGCSGLGLAIVASIVEAHRGTVTCESRPGRTTFTVRLPSADDLYENAMQITN